MLNLIINCGSSTIKYKLIDLKNLRLIKSGLIDKIHAGHEAAIKKIAEKLKNYDIKVISHRVVHGGAKFNKATILDKKILTEIEKLNAIAPLHNPLNLKGIHACQKIMSGIPQAAIFDTGFFSTLPKKSFIYPLPEKFHDKEKIRRYGFHGSSHKFIVRKTQKILKKKKSKIISCHLGNGCSITASINAEAVETSMGFSPLEGVMMGTRSGSIDPTIIFHLQRKLKMSPEKIEEILNKESGLKAVSEIGGDMRKIFMASKKKNLKATFAIEIFSYQIAKYIGSFAAAMNGLDAVAFSGGIGENAWYVRKEVCNYLVFFGIKISKQKNLNNDIIISTPASKIKVFVIPTDEEMQIAEETKTLLNL